MNENLNLVKVLKNCPKGTKLYSPIYGTVEFCEVQSHNTFPIVVAIVKHGNNLDFIRWFTSDGRYDDYPDAECMLFPSSENRDWSTFVTPEILPKTWKEFCETHPIKQGECYVDDFCSITHILEDSRTRNDVTDKKVLPDEKYAKAMRALCQLLQLRDCYNDGWKPDYHDNESKPCIDIQGDEIYPTAHVSLNRILVFKTNDIRDKFLKNFRHLIEIAKELL